MKKFFKFLFGAFSLAAAAFGVYLLYKQITKNDDTDDFDEFDDDFEDFETEKEGNASESREYTPINIGGNKEEATDETEAHEAEETASETTDDSTEEAE